MEKIDPKTINKIKKMRKSLSYKEIADRLRISPSTAHKYSKEIKVSENGKKRILNKIIKNQKKFASTFSKEKKIKENKNITPEKVRIISHCLFDGSVNSTKNGVYRVQYTNASKISVNEFISDMKNVFGLEPTEYSKVNGKNIEWYTVSFYSKKLFNRILQSLPEYSTAKENCRLKPWILNLSSKLKSEFLRAFWDDEGCIDINGKIHGKSKSKKVIKQLKEIHASLGIKTSIWRDNTSNNYALYIKKDPLNIKKFSLTGFKHGIICRGKNIGKLKKEVFHEYYKGFL